MSSWLHANKQDGNKRNKWEDAANKGYSDKEDLEKHTDNILHGSPFQFVTSSKLFNRTYIIREMKKGQSALGYFKLNDENELEYQGKIIITDLNNKHFTPTKIMQHQKERIMLLLNESNPGCIYVLDLDKGKVIEEWQTKDELNDIAPLTKHCDMTDNSMIYGLNRNSQFMIDGRIPQKCKIVINKQKGYKSRPNLNVIATSGNGFIATGSKDGKIRLHDAIEKRQKTCFPGLGHSINYMEISYDAQWILVTCNDYIMVIPTVVPDTERTGFEGRGMGKLKPNPYILRLKNDDIQKYEIKQVSFSPAHFDHGKNINERWIISSTGSYIIIWNFNKLKKYGIINSYSIRKAKSNIVQLEFRFNHNDDILVAETNAVYTQHTVTKQSYDEKMENDVNGDDNVNKEEEAKQNHNESQTDTNKEWNCSVCTFSNVAVNNICIMCKIGNRGDVQSYDEKMNVNEEKEFDGNLENMLAVLICVGTYNSKNMKDLPGTQIDKERLIKLLQREYKYDVIANKESRVTKDVMEDILHETKKKFRKKENNYQGILIFFSGHGNSEWLLLSDFVDNNSYHGKYSRKEFETYFSGTKVIEKRKELKFYFIDSCRGGTESRVYKEEELRMNDPMPVIAMGGGNEYVQGTENISLLFSNCDTMESYEVPYNEKEYDVYKLTKENYMSLNDKPKCGVFMNAVCRTFHQNAMNGFGMKYSRMEGNIQRKTQKTIVPLYGKFATKIGQVVWAHGTIYTDTKSEITFNKSSNNGSVQLF